MSVDQAAPFEQHYFQDVYRAAYDQRNPRYKHRSYLREVRRLAPQGGTLLDVGCAYGAFLAEAAGDYSCTGCDIWATPWKWPPAGSRMPVFQSDVMGVIPAGDYDVVTCFDVLEHVPDLDAALTHLGRVLRLRGALVISVPVYDTPVGRLVGLLDRDPLTSTSSRDTPGSSGCKPPASSTFAGPESCVTTSADRCTCTGARPASGVSARPSS